MQLIERIQSQVHIPNNLNVAKHYGKCPGLFYNFVFFGKIFQISIQDGID